MTGVRIGAYMFHRTQEHIEIRAEELPPPATRSENVTRFLQDMAEDILMVSMAFSSLKLSTYTLHTNTHTHTELFYL